VPRALIALTALAAALRLPTLGSQSLWLDEVLTGRLARGSLGDLLHQVAEQEANPPLFYLVEWLWTRLAGTSELALRLPSAVCGIALVPVAYAIGRRLGQPRAAVALAALVAVHPLLVYYSQEARGYAAVALACAVGFLCFLDAVEGRRGALGWALASAVALGCHYFAIFPVAIEAAILLARRGRAALPALAAVGVAGAALLPLVLEQLDGGHGDNVTAGLSLAGRVKGIVASWLVGERGAAIANLEWLAGVLMLAGAVMLAVRGERGAAILPAAVGGGGAALMLLAALAGADYLNNRNTLPVLVILLAIPALGFAAGRAGAALGAAACAALLAATLGALIDPAHAREDWRDTARELRAGEAVVLPPRKEVALSWYAPGLHAAPAANVRELAVVLTDPERNPLPAGALDTPPAAGFNPAGTRTRDRILIARYRAPAPQPVTREAVDAWARSHLDPIRGAGGATLLARR
jgi:mannosyltransferase